MFVYIIIAVLLIVLSFMCGRGISAKVTEQENDYIKDVNRQLEQQYQTKQQELNNINNSLLKRTQEIESNIREKELDALRAEQEIENKLVQIKDYRFSKISMAASQYRQEQFDRINQDCDARRAMTEETIDKLTRQKETIMSEISDLQNSRDALIEAYKRAEEDRLKDQFYKIELSAHDLSDIKLIKSIEHALYNKEPLYKAIWTTFYSKPVKELLLRIVGANKTSGIYKITNNLNGKVYIGQSVDLHTRLTNHIKASVGLGNIAHQLVHDAMAAEGLENFSFEVVEKCAKEQLNKKEKLWIETYASDKYGYNKTSGGA